MENFKIVKPFGPSVVKVRIPNDIIGKLNIYIDEILKNEQKTSELDHGKNLVGDVTQEFKLERKIMEESGWGNFLASSCGKWIEFEFKKKLTKFIIKDSWVVRQFQNEYNPTHWHDGHISGAGFLKVPKNLGKHTQGEKKINRKYKGGNLQLIHGNKLFACDSTLSIEPQVGDFYLFPHYLMHTVFPFKNNDEERRSISFNAFINEEIYNVYNSST